VHVAHTMYKYVFLRTEIFSECTVYTMCDCVLRLLKISCQYGFAQCVTFLFKICAAIELLIVFYAVIELLIVFYAVIELDRVQRGD
jgi:hypothetical protein